MKIWLISDTHNHHDLLTIPEVDMVIHGGDCTSSKDLTNNEIELSKFLTWYRSLNIKYKLMISGNHDRTLETSAKKWKEENHPNFDTIIYLENELIDIEGIKIYGSPLTPEFGRDWAFNLPKDKIGAEWNKIPQALDILVTHGPPKGILDLTQYDSRPGADGKSFFQCGCESLLQEVKIKKPNYHMFGHIHTEKNCPNSGMLKIANCDTTFINAAVCDFSKSDVPGIKSIKNVVNNGYIIEI